MSVSRHTLALPASPLATEAFRLITAELEPHLRNHSIRGYLFGLALAGAHGLRPGADFDDENMFLICALHDMGLAEIANGDQRFEVDGADYAAKFLEDRGVRDARVDVIWDAIAAHTTGLSSSPVYRRRRPAEIWIAVDGIGIDVGAGPGALPPGYADLVHAAYPRLGGSRALTDAIESQAIAKPQKAVPGSLAGEIVRRQHPHLVPTWDQLLSTSGWND
ncbi:HD domain-containing protein [Nocardia wallacei]|uniref:HD domain-containing protein n=1 Tax=Nocardia wallacei TaxID=480035 RepID=UPI002453BA5C|nr:HD domain-containing protein [Nocardia wallacei]